MHSLNCLAAMAGDDTLTVLDRLSRMEGKLDELLECKLKVDRIEEILLKLEASMSSPQKPSDFRPPRAGAKEAFADTPVIPPDVPPPSILKRVRTEDEVDQVDFTPFPEAEAPHTLAVVPEEMISQAGAGTTAKKVSQERRTSLFSQRSSQSQRNVKVVDFAAASVDDLSLKTTRQLLRGFSMCSQDVHGRDHHENLTSHGSGSLSGRLSVLEKTQNLSLDELRANHNALVTARSMRSVASIDDHGSMPHTAELLLVVVGILEFPSLGVWRIWVCCLLVSFMTAAAFLTWWTSLGVLEADLVCANCCYMAGVAASIWMLRNGDIQELLKDDESSLDMYAKQAGWVEEWRPKSRRRLLEAFGCFIVICSSRYLVFLHLPVSIPDLVLTTSFCLASIGFVGVVYLQLHILSGLKLAIDGFSVSFFRDMDFETAVSEWNILQAMLRHVSMKLSGSLLTLGFASGSSILYLIELGFVRTDVPQGFQFFLHHLWSLPPILMFLYAMMRAALVTEKVNRVSPLVNSWTFDSEDPEDEWMDLKRQYVVQYINQSEAGFYMQGVRIRIFQVSKMFYYLSAVLFAVTSRMVVGGS